MRPLSELDDGQLANCVAVLTDIDDTLTTDGQLPAAAYAALERLADAGLAVVPITGRPAGWCDMIARLWPVAGIVGENGAFYFSYDREKRVMRQKFFATAEERRKNRFRLDVLRQDILAKVPGAGIASDQLYREADLAIDFCEDVPALPEDQVQLILDMFKEAGAVAKLSSIHVNGWFGNYDKLSMSRIFAKDILGMDLDADRTRIIFAGDSPNDGPMFEFFPNSCGVANVRDFEPGSFAPPAFVAPSEGGAGFVEIAERILSAHPVPAREAAHV
ncbi:MAG: HAD-IIB family hydrolase [Alphaproteobacteria bacterium]|nr:HAD-IIB family hydrolase [Alphaproteobacteria bacterium]MBU1278106.1 HAD-IIB family hydrolase [Alphaproteobacteria bacterium]MBU1573965.1 HAD-IIB family hydrolase [Alphaproteobacteria bacterium]MBU1830407.1 HAD-IIB family hydrolase [Alphaproteobacteria bacterium]MBU2077189.1 HAD-IIB family hydrolase [Alphaproteobacteria bacterium]